MLKTLKIHRFRNVEPGTSLEFAEGFNVFLGKNGTGKTTLLELISMILRSDFSSLRGEEFDIEYEFGYEQGEGKVHFQNKKQRLRTPIPVPRDELQPERVWSISIERESEYRPAVSISLTLRGEGHHPLEIEIDGPSVRRRRHGAEWEQSNGFVNVFARNFMFYIRTIPAWKTQIIFGMEEDAVLRNTIDNDWTFRFDESLQTFDRIIGGDPRLQPISLTVYFLREGGGRYGRGADFVPFSYEPQRPDAGQSSVQVTVPPGSFIQKFPELAGFDRMAMSFAVKGSHEEGPIVGWDFDHAEFMFSRSGGFINHNALSYGQKRLLAFLYYLDANETYVIADELVNGMHNDWISACVDLIGARQSFLTSQNPLLLDYIPLQSAEQVKRTFLRCTAKTSGDPTTFVWANLSDDEARELFADHEVGIQPVGELLRVRGLW